MRSPEADAVAQLVHHINVRAGKWKSPYDIYEWQFVNDIPERFRPAITIAERVLNPKFDWDAEAFRIEYDTHVGTSLQVVMKSHGGAPLNVPWFGRPNLKLDEVLSPIFHSLTEKYPVKLRYREFLQVEFPQIFFLAPEGKDIEDMEDTEIALLPGYDRLIIKPFWFFEGEDEKERAVGEDPFRLVFHLFGAPIFHMYRVLKAAGVSDEKFNSVIFGNSNPFQGK